MENNEEFFMDKLARFIDKGDDASTDEWFHNNEDFIDGKDMQQIIDDLAYYQETGIKSW